MNRLFYVPYVPMWFKKRREFEPHRNIGHIDECVKKDITREFPTVDHLLTQLANP